MRLPFGYARYLEDEGYSPKTVETYVDVVNVFFQHLDKTYKRKKELYEISPKDIKDFLEELLNQGSKVSTVNKHLTILKGFFDYLWERDKIPIDPAAKIKRYQKREIKPLAYTYEQLLELQPKVLQKDYSFLRKSVFILALRGLRTADFQFTKDCVEEKSGVVHIKQKKLTIILEGLEAECFMRYYYESLFNESDYVFVTKKHSGEIIPIHKESLYTHLNIITKDFKIRPRLSLNGIRHARVYYLHKKKGYTVDDIAKTFGIQKTSAANLIKFSLERAEKIKSCS